MASLGRSPYGVYALTFRYGGCRYHRSLRTKSEAKAQRKKGVIETSLEQLESGLLDVPPNVTADQLWQILQAGSAQPQKPQISSRIVLRTVCDEYLASYTRGTKEDSTIATESHHLNHLNRLLGTNTSLSELTPAILRQYVVTRETEPGTWLDQRLFALVAQRLGKLGKLMPKSLDLAWISEIRAAGLL